MNKDITYKIMRLVKNKDSITFDLYNDELKINFELKFCCCLRTTYYYEIYNYYLNCQIRNLNVTITQIENDFIIHKLKNNIP